MTTIALEHGSQEFREWLAEALEPATAPAESAKDEMAAWMAAGGVVQRG